jgi:hypothetical protein
MKSCLKSVNDGGMEYQPNCVTQSTCLLIRFFRFKCSSISKPKVLHFHTLLYALHYNRYIKYTVENYSLLTYSMEQSPSWEANQSLQLTKKFPAFYGTQRFFTVLTRARHPSLSWANSIQSPRPGKLFIINFKFLSLNTNYICKILYRRRERLSTVPMWYRGIPTHYKPHFPVPFTGTMWWLACSFHFHTSEGQNDKYPRSKTMVIESKKNFLFIKQTQISWQTNNAQFTLIM